MFWPAQITLEVAIVGSKDSCFAAQERLLAERRIQHLESSSSSTRQELNAARLAGIAERQKDDRQISSLKAQVSALNNFQSSLSAQDL